MPFGDKEREAFERAREAFDAWWEHEGQFLDPDPRNLACWSFVAGIASVGEMLN